MPLQWNIFRTRALSALLFAAIMLLGLLWNEWSFLLLFVVVHFGCWAEYQKLMGLIDKGYAAINPFHRYGIMVGGLGLMLLLTGNWKLGNDLLLHEVGFFLFIMALVVVAVSELLFSRQLLFSHLLISLLGLLYISLSWGLLLHIRSGALWMPKDGGTTFSNIATLLARISGYAIPLIIVGSIWVSDTMAYIVGSLIGKTPLSKVSPQKTWEGTVGGVVLAVAVMTLIGLASGKGSAWYWAVIALLAAVAGTAGDLLESKLKRVAGVKDSGNVLPGHGGFLDRFDSLLLAVPVIWLFLKITAL